MARRALAALSCAAALGVAGCCPPWWDYCRVVSFESGAGREIVLYEDGFCDRATGLYFEVRVDRRVVALRQATGLYIQCGELAPERLRLVADDAGDLVAVTYDRDGEGGDRVVVLVYDFETRQAASYASLLYDRDIPTALLDRLGLPVPD